MWAPDPCRPIR